MIIKEKIEQAKKLLKEFNIDCWITFVRESGINGDPILQFLAPASVTWHSAFIITKTGKAIAIVGQYDKKMIEDLNTYNNVIGYVKSIKEPLLENLKIIAPKEIALNFSIGSEISDGITHGMYLTLMNYLRKIKFKGKIVSAENIVSALRERKAKSEIENIKAAIKHTEQIFKLVSKFIKAGKTENQIAQFMRDEVKKRKLEFSWDENVCPAVFTGPDTAQAHYKPLERKVKPGHVLNMDFGVKVNKYCSDMQRTFYILEKNEKNAPPEVLKGFYTIVEAIQGAKNAIKPGMLGHQIDKIARDIITKNGYEEFPHGLGHQVGIYAHDGTALLGPKWEKYADKPFKKLEEGMVFTIEPRLSVPNRGTVTIEEMVVVTKTGAEWLSTPQKNIILI